jgi:membrane protein required for colicin V production
MDMSQLNWVDYIIIGMISFSVLISLVRGFVREAISLLIWTAAVVLAIHFAGDASEVMRAQIATDNIRYGVAFAIIFIAVLVIGVFINAFISALVSKTGMGALDRLVGVVFGFLRGVLVVGVLLLFVAHGGIANGDAVKHSQLTPEFKPLVSWLADLMPQKVSEFSKWLDVKQYS